MSHKKNDKYRESEIRFVFISKNHGFISVIEKHVIFNGGNE